MRYEVQAARNLLPKLSTAPSAVSPWTSEAEVQVQAWAAQSGLIRSQSARARFRRTAPGELSGRVYATAVDSGRLSAAATWIGWLFLIDDQLDEGATGRDPALARQRLRPFAAMAARMAAGSVPAAGETAEADETAAGMRRLPLLGALAGLWSRIAPAMPATWHGVFARHYLDYLRGCEWEAANRASSRIPAESDFTPNRREAGAIWPSLDLLEYVAAAPIPDRLREDEQLTGIRTACADVVCWTDDLLTVGKERAHGDVHNLAIVLQHATGCGERDALDMVARRIEARIADFADLRRQITAMDVGDEARSALGGHLEGLHHWMHGHLEWGLRTSRYDTGGGTAAYLEDLLS